MYKNIRSSGTVNCVFSTSRIRLLSHIFFRSLTSRWRIRSRFLTSLTSPCNLSSRRPCILISSNQVTVYSNILNTQYSVVRQRLPRHSSYYNLTRGQAANAFFIFTYSASPIRLPTNIVSCIYPNLNTVSRRITTPTTTRAPALCQPLKRYNGHIAFSEPLLGHYIYTPQTYLRCHPRNFRV
jgi:hypothetical protein